jgi:hypothetical protein
MKSNAANLHDGTNAKSERSFSVILKKKPVEVVPPVVECKVSSIDMTNHLFATACTFSSPHFLKADDRPLQLSSCRA